MSGSPAVEVGVNMRVNVPQAKQRTTTNGGPSCWPGVPDAI